MISIKMGMMGNFILASGRIGLVSFDDDDDDDDDDDVEEFLNFVQYSKKMMLKLCCVF